MTENRIRKILNEGKTSVCTRLESSWPFYYEDLAATGKYDYAEFAGENAPFTVFDLENICRASELYNMGTMIKVDLQNRGYIAQKAVASGFQAILFADHETPDEIRESIRMMKPNTPEDKGMFGFPTRRFIGCQPMMKQMDHAQRVRDVVLAFMIEKACAVDRIEEICEIPGIDMIQFGPSDYSMSLGYNKGAFNAECKTAEARCIKVALKNGIAPRCEIGVADDAKYYLDLGVRHFSIGDQYKVLHSFWIKEGDKIAKVLSDEGLI